MPIRQLRNSLVFSLLAICWAAVTHAQLQGQSALPVGSAAETMRPALIRSTSLRRLPTDQEQVDPAPEPLPIWMLADLESMAAANNPALAAAQAKVEAAHGRWLQAGLKPNPVAGYIGDDIGAGGEGGAHGAFIRQEFIRGQKLQLNRQVAAAEIARADAEYQAASMRVMTDVRMNFYRALLAQRRLETTQELSRVSEQAADAAKRLLDVREGRRVDYLRARIEADQLAIAVREANSKHIAAWRALAAVVGLPNMSRRRLDGDLDDDLPQFDYEVIENELIASPQVAAAEAEAERTAWAIDRAEAEVIPNVEAGLEIKRDTASDDTLVVIEAGIQLPLWNKNQGASQAACADHHAAVARISQLQLRLRRDLAEEFEKYETARATALQYARDILPNTRTTVELTEEGLKAGELTFLDALTARRTLYRANLDYLDALEVLWVSAQRIEGLLLSESLEPHE